MEVGQANQLKLSGFTLATNFTIEFWGKQASAGNRVNLVCDQSNLWAGGSTITFPNWLTSTTGLTTNIVIGNVSINLNATGSNALLNTLSWSHIAIVVSTVSSNVTVKVFKNGSVALSSTVSNFSMSSLTQLHFPSGSPDNINISYRDIRISSNARYSSAFTPASEFSTDVNTIYLMKLVDNVWVNGASGTSVIQTGF
jgi:hypothetical protein